ncbi:hypothetical protein HPB47_027353 [Ixodes persulcatus]|uniref:Uncharacterized protein n=1 Tax=Ixodes persulcatus TaxID=34615 RepID=A0AC60PXV3_IXOPE|nr:hypothetical protein HPB47_027353 [Ixodes persulcatus]
METAASNWPSLQRGSGALSHWPALWLPLATAPLPVLSASSSSPKWKSPMAKKSKKKLLEPPSEKERFVEAQSSTDDVNAQPSTLSVTIPFREAPSMSTNRTIQAHLQTKFVSTEVSRECATAVQGLLSAVLATERKMQLTGEGEKPTSVEPFEEFLVVQVVALNALLSETPCQKCLRPGIIAVQKTQLGLAVKMVLTCSMCGAVTNGWSSPRKEDSRAFEVNLRSMQAMKSVGKGSTALTDFWSVMNVLHRGLRQKTFQGHLKNTFRPAADAAAASDKKGQSLGGRGGLTQELIKRLTSYYGMALRSHPNLADMKRALVASSSTSSSQPQPAHKYRLASHVTAALLPVYQRLSEPQLLDRCKGKKTECGGEPALCYLVSLSERQTCIPGCSRDRRQRDNLQVQLWQLPCIHRVLQFPRYPTWGACTSESSREGRLKEEEGIEISSGKGAEAEEALCQEGHGRL